jgi:hypothetical protein
MLDWSSLLGQLKKNIFKYRLKPQYQRKFRIGAFIILGLILVLILWGPVSNKIESIANPTSYGRIKVDKYRDYNSLHLKYARKNGITAFKSSADFHQKLDVLLDEDRLVKIKNNKYYVIKHLSHSYPYLTPKAEQLLEDIGKRFQKKLHENNMGNYSYEISSLLRTKESQNRLKTTNVNASSNTSHLYGTTFDIAYNSVVKRSFLFMKIETQDAKAIKLLSEAIGELRRENRCVVVTERIEKCFHITVR